ncbi:hypothetical protein B0H17DRAFT_1140327 [Mycena rosella]|uniref:Uncharacterized protein n=1 Tax=Mycena rosella TaxID=1033263 RepID=A0AAD7D234_MYCRO|nr:hypothetical protein B0H17DRAFT_1140327 [Mycena rosella]
MHDTARERKGHSCTPFGYSYIPGCREPVRLGLEPSGVVRSRHSTSQEQRPHLRTLSSVPGPIYAGNPLDSGSSHLEVNVDFFGQASFYTVYRSLKPQTSVIRLERGWAAPAHFGSIPTIWMQGSVRLKLEPFADEGVDFLASLPFTLHTEVEHTS